MRRGAQRQVAATRVGNRVLLGVKGAGYVRLKPREARDLAAALAALAGPEPPPAQDHHP